MEYQNRGFKRDVAGSFQNKGMITGIIVLVVLSFVMITTLPAVSALPVTVQEIKVDGSTLTEGSTTRLSIERGESFDVRVEMTSSQDLDNVEVEAFIAGYEYNDIERISDTAPVFDMESGVVYVKRFSLNLPSRVDTDDYRLRIIVADRYGSADIHEYKLKVDAVRHLVTIREIILNPYDYVKAGRSLLASVRVKNFGQLDEDNLKVIVSVPELGVSGIDYINRDLNPDETTTSEEIMLRIPTCAENGIYTVRATVDYDDMEKRTVSESQIRIEAAPSCNQDSSQQPSQPSTPNVPSQPSAVISVDKQSMELARNVGGGIFTVGITNNGASTRSYSLVLSGHEGILDARISPTNLLLVSPGQTKQAFIYLAAKEDAALGQASVLLSVSAQGQLIKQVPLSLSIVESGVRAKASTAKILETVFVSLLVLLIIIGIILLIVSRFRQDGSGSNDAEGSEEYY